jgi:REP element-mobilizing transposase RayT
MKSRISFSPIKLYLFLSHAAGIRLPYKGATGEKIIMENVISGSPKKLAGDTRNNWVTMMFVTHNRYNCLRKQIYIDVLLRAFHDLERFGFEFGEFGFAFNHVHFLVNIPKRYSIQTAEIILKSYTARKMFEIFPGFRKRYPRGGFWSGYEHYESTGLKNFDQSSAYVRDQARHHNAYVVDDKQQRLPTTSAE